MYSLSSINILSIIINIFSIISWVYLFLTLKKILEQHSINNTKKIVNY